MISNESTRIKFSPCYRLSVCALSSCHVRKEYLFVRSSNNDVVKVSALYMTIYMLHVSLSVFSSTRHTSHFNSV